MPVMEKIRGAHRREHAKLQFAWILPLALFVSGCTFWDVDKCLDRGGRWNHEKEHCEFK